MYLCVRNAPAFHSTVLYVGFQSLADNVTEGAGHELACVEVMVTVPLLEELTVSMFTVDGTAQGL